MLEIGAGSRCKYEILGRDRVRRLKADPFAQYTEVPPVDGVSGVPPEYTWGDAEWIAARAAADPHNGPMSIYEVHLVFWRPGLDYLGLAEDPHQLRARAGFTHVEFLPVAGASLRWSWAIR